MRICIFSNGKIVSGFDLDSESESSSDSSTDSNQESNYDSESRNSNRLKYLYKYKSKTVNNYFVNKRKIFLQNELESMPQHTWEALFAVILTIYILLGFNLFTQHVIS